MPIPLTVWDKQLEHYGSALIAAAATHSLVVAKKVVAKSYRGITLSSTHGTFISMDTTLEPVTTLKQRFDTVGILELPKLVEDYSVPFTKDLDRGLTKKVCVGDIQPSEKCGDFWTRSFLQVTEGDQRLYYVGCSNCYTKINVPPNKKYLCLLCDKVVLTIRY